MSKKKVFDEDSSMAISNTMKEDIQREEDMKEINMFSHWDEDLENTESGGMFDRYSERWF